MNQSDNLRASQLLHEATHKYPKIFSFDHDENGEPTAFRVEYDTKRNSARTIEAAKLYIKRVYEELAALDHGLF